MHRRALVVVGLLLAAGAFAQTSEEIETKLLEEVNAHRAKKGAPKLEADDDLNAIAQAHAQGMARADKFGDNGKNGHVWQGKGPADRIKAAGYKHLGAAENVGYNYGQKDPVAYMMKTWLSSANHQKNIVNKDFTRTGIAAAKSKSGKWYLVQLFAKPAVVVKPKPGKTSVMVRLENQTKQTIAYRIEKSKYELEPGKATRIEYSTSAAKAQIAVTWPAAKKEELFDLADKANYAFVEKGKDRYAFEKTEAKAEAKVAVTIANKTGEVIAFRVGTKKYELGAEKIGALTHSSRTGTVQIGVTWPGARKEELYDLADKATYTLTKKGEGKYVIEKMEPKKEEPKKEEK